MARWLVHGIRVAVESGLEPDPSERLLGRFAGDDAGPDGADLTLRLQPSRSRVRTEGEGRLVMDLRGVRAHLRGGELRMSDGASVLAVAPGGHLIDGHVHPESLGNPDAFENVLLLLAIAASLRWHGLFHLHAAAVSSPAAGGILIAGDSGAGKSTLALALAQHGFRWLSDDVSFLAARLEGPAILGFPRPFHVSEATASAFPRISWQLGARYSWKGKRLLDPRLAFPGQEQSEIKRPGTILLPEVVRAPWTEIEPVATVDAIGTLVESSALLFVDGMPRVQENVKLLRDLLDGARCLRVRLGVDLLRDPPVWAATMAAALERSGV